MNRLWLLCLGILWNVTILGQENLPKGPYLLVIEADTFVTETFWEANPSFRKQREGENYNAFIHNLKRRWTYLFKEDTIRIDFPQRVDEWYSIDPETGEE